MNRKVLLITFTIFIFLLNKVQEMGKCTFESFVPEVVTLPTSLGELSNKFVGRTDPFWLAN